MALMPLSWKLSPAKEAPYFSPLDLLLPILAVLMVMDLIMRRSWARFGIPPVPGILWAGVAALSLLWSYDPPALAALKTWAHGALNPFLFGLAAVWVFQNLADEAAEYRRLALILLGSFGVCVLWALYQYVGREGLPYDPYLPERDLQGVSNYRVAGWYDYRDVFGAQAALLVPAAGAFALLDKDAAVRWAGGAVALLALCVTLAAGGFVGACAGIIAVAAAFALSRCTLTGVAVLGILLALVVVVLPRLPRHNPKVLFRGLAFFAEHKDEMKPTAGLRRHQAVLDLLAAPSNGQNQEGAPYWLKGVGAGRYQERINQFYEHEPPYPYVRPGERTDDETVFDMEAHEKFSFGLLETVAVELGVPGLLAVLFLLASWIAAAQGAFARLASPAPPSGPDTRREIGALLALAALGAGCGALVLSLFGNPAIRGVGGSFAFFFAVALCAARWAQEPQTNAAQVGTADERR
ncbi:MAG: hypothetical protein ABSE73_04295 [Planctomycetota bacterium]